MTPTRDITRTAGSVLLVGLLIVGTGCDSPAGTPRAESTAASTLAAASTRWTPMADSPLSPRYGSVGTWTGDELVVVGGTENPPCPPTADCTYGPEFGARTDGAAYDPNTDSWRSIAPAPRPVTAGLAAWSGDEMLVVTRRHALVYSPYDDVWRVLDRPPAPYFNQVLVTDLGVVFGDYDKPRRTDERVDWVLDPGTGAWTPLPPDPFGESYDRSLAWDGERLWLLSMAVSNHFSAYDGAPSRVAVLEDGRWSVEVEQTPEVEQGQRWWWFQDRLVAPASPYTPDSQLGRTFDPTTGGWEELPPAEGASNTSGCALLAAGVGPSWLSGGGPVLTSLEPPGTTLAPSCPGLGVPDVTVWAGDELLVWGGVAPRYEGNVGVGFRWRPPPPD